MAAIQYNRDIASLPNEILINILSLFPTRSLLPLTTTSRRIHDIILRIIHYRLLAAANLADHQMILECFLPSAKLSTPYFVCDFLGTDPIDDEDLEGLGALGKLRGLYSHFRPTQPEGNRKVWKPLPTGRWLPATMNEFIDGTEEYVSQNIDLESHEYFSQLQSVVHVVKVGSRKDFFLSRVTIGEGITRIWRDWLSEQGKRSSPKTSAERDSEAEAEYKNRLLWSSIREDFGMRLCVNQRKDVPAPILRSRDEDENIGYTLQYEELVVRTSQILLMLEKSIEQEFQHSGKAIVIIS